VNGGVAHEEALRGGGGARCARASRGGGRADALRVGGESEWRALRRSSVPAAMAMATAVSPAAAATALVRARARRRQGAGRGADDGVHPNGIWTGLKASREPDRRPPLLVARCHTASAARGKVGAGRSVWARGSRAGAALVREWARAS
jgi:hypothetical protein